MRALTLFIVLVLTAGCQTRAATPPTRVVAIGDLHGDRDQALAVLKLAGLVDAEGRWAGGTATLVQTGDTTDRGPDSKGVLALVRRLQAEAPAAGGRVVPLLGNHEVMNLHGDWRYVSPEDASGYGGVEARKAAFAREGEDGAWLAGLDGVAMVGDTAFAHGGITGTWAVKGVKGINEAVHAALFTNPRAAVLGEDGPLWYRGYVQDDEAKACPALGEALKGLGARRMVVGHTTRKDGRIQTRCGGRLTVIDVGIASHYGGHLAAWELVDGRARAMYPGETQDLEDPS